MQRRECRSVNIGKVTIGGTASIAVQSMGCVPSHDVEGSVRQAKALCAAATGTLPMPPTACTTRVMVPRSVSESAMVRGMRSPLSPQRTITK